MGVLANYSDSVTLINRTTSPLQVRYDGEAITLQPGENPGFPKVAVQFAKNQNLLKGTLHPNGNMKSATCMVGVKGSKDNCTPIDPEVLAEAAAKYELWDRDGSVHGEPMRKVQLSKRTGYSAYEAAVVVPGFDNNNSIE
jgi:hypothetical protein